MKKLCPLLVLIILINPGINAQNVGINSTGAAPNASAMLDVASTTSGVLIPRMTTVQKNAIVSPATGLIVYDLTLNQFYYYNGSAWVPFLVNSSSTSGGWSLTGNTGTSAATDFIGTTDATDWVIKTNGSEQMRVLSGGNVGIGTNNPLTKLHVSGGHALIDQGYYYEALNTFGFQVGMMKVNGGNSIQIGDASASYGEMVLFTPGFNPSDVSVYSGTSSSSIACFRNDGNVGIGTTSPLTRFHVSGGHALVDNGYYYEGLNTFGFQVGMMKMNSGNVLQIGDASASYAETILMTPGVNPSDVSVYSGTSSTSIACFRNDGNVGIGTTSPLTRFHVSGGHALIDEGYYYEGLNTFGFQVGMMRVNGANSIQIGDATASYGEVAIYTPAFSPSDVSIYSGTSSQSIAYFKDNGNVGIGTTAPTATLHVKNGHYKSEQTTAPTIAVTTGTGITAAALSSATDTKGIITTTGTNSGAANTVLTITFNKIYNTAPVAIITPSNASAQACTFFVTTTTTTMVLNFKGAFATPSFNYFIME